MNSKSAPNVLLNLILERAGPEIIKTLLLELIPVIFILQQEQSLRITENDSSFQAGPIPQ